MLRQRVEYAALCGTFLWPGGTTAETVVSWFATAALSHGFISPYYEGGVRACEVCLPTISAHQIELIHMAILSQPAHQIELMHTTSLSRPEPVHESQIEAVPITDDFDLMNALAPIIVAMETGQYHSVKLLSDQNDHKSNLLHSATAVAARLGRLDYLKLLHKKGFAWDECTCNEAAGNGHLNCLSYAFRKGCPCDERAYVWAAAGGHLSCMKYLYKKRLPWNVDVCKEALRANQLECFKFAAENGCPFDEDSLLDAMHEQDPKCFTCVLERTTQIRADACTFAARAGYVRILRMLHERYAAWDESTTAAAAGGGHINTLRYLLGQGCPVDSSAYIQAADKGNLACIQMLRSHELSRQSSTTNALPPTGPVSWDERTMNAALQKRYLHVLRYAVASGCPCDTGFIVLAARRGDIACLRFAVEKVGVLREQQVQATAAAAACGDLDCLVYLHNLKYPWNETATDSAAMGGCFAALKYLTRHGCPCTSSAMVLAAASGSLLCLKLLYDKELCEYPTQNGLLFGAALLSNSVKCVDFVTNTILYPIENYVYDDLSEELPQCQPLDDDATLPCVALAVNAGWTWNAAFMRHLSDEKCAKSLAYLRQYKRTCACPRGSKFFHTLGTHGACAAYENDHGLELVNFDNPDMSNIALRAMCNRMWRYASAYGCVHCVMALFDQRAPGELEGMLAATKACQIHCLSLMLELGCLADETVTAAAAGAGSVLCLDKLYKSGCSFDASTANAAARAGKVDTLQYAIWRMQCPVSNVTVQLAAAAQTGSAECLRCLAQVGLVPQHDVA